LPARAGGNKNVARSTSSQPTTTSSQQVEKQKPAPGKGNVQGKVLYNSKTGGEHRGEAVSDFQSLLWRVQRENITAKTDKDGDYVVADVEPGTYEGLLARVFDTDSFVFATTGLTGINAQKYEVVADKTLFIPPTSLFKGDLKLVNPKPGSKVGQNLELKWQGIS
jgi:hypothetical protein